MRQRFAPSPTGFLHIGHAFSALTAWHAAQDAAKDAGGDFLLRIEDIDVPRCRAEYEVAIFDDLHWLGLTWPKPVMRQSDRMAAYQDAIHQLVALGLCYPCRCTRKDISNALSAPQEGVDQAFGPDGPIYPGTCAPRSMGDLGAGDAVRLSMTKAIDYLGGASKIAAMGYHETGPDLPQQITLDADSLIARCGDIVLARKDIGTSYHLSVVVDDAAQGITHVTRGCDMAPATSIHRVLQALLGLPTPIYHHHRLIRDEAGKRLAKRDDARSIQSYRNAGMTPDQVLGMIGLA